MPGISPVSADAASAGAGAGGAINALSTVRGVGENREEWVSVGGSWRDEENVCGYWRFSDAIEGEGGQLEPGTAVLGPHKQVILPLSRTWFVSGCAWTFCV